MKKVLLGMLVIMGSSCAVTPKNEVAREPQQVTVDVGSRGGGNGSQISIDKKAFRRSKKACALLDSDITKYLSSDRICTEDLQLVKSGVVNDQFRIDSGSPEENYEVIIRMTKGIEVPQGYESHTGVLSFGTNGLGLSFRDDYIPSPAGLNYLYVGINKDGNLLFEKKSNAKSSLDELLKTKTEFKYKDLVGLVIRLRAIHYRAEDNIFEIIIRSKEYPEKFQRQTYFFESSKNGQDFNASTLRFIVTSNN